MKNRPVVGYCAVLLLALFCSSCDSIHIQSYTNAGAPGSMVLVEGEVSWARVLWDVGTPNQRYIPSGFLGANFFTVPHNAEPGLHQFRIVRNNEQSDVMNFDVTASRPATSFTDVVASPIWTLFRDDGKVITWVMVQGPNIDAGATVYVDDRRAPTLSYKVMINDLHGIDPATLNFPKYHYTALLVMIPLKDAGSTVELKVVNLDGFIPNGGTRYKLPLSAESIDSDGDNIPDKWEKGGYDANNDGRIDVDLRALGADPYRKDVFLELDIMNGLSFPPDESVFDAVKTSFASSPFISARSAPNGVNLHIDHSGSVPYFDFISHECCSDQQMGLVDLYDLKREYFDNTGRGRIFQYGVWAHAMQNGSSGVSDSDPLTSNRYFIVPGDELVVSMDDFSQSYQTTRNRASTLMHEIGHNLLQSHGGANMYPYNPAYHSVMSYSWQLRTGENNSFRTYKWCCAPLFYAHAGAREINGDVYHPTGTVIDYSEGMGLLFQEASLDEREGLCDHVPVDWNSNGVIDTDPVSVNVDQTFYTSNPFGIEQVEQFGDFCNWCELNFQGPEKNGKRDF